MKNFCTELKSSALYCSYLAISSEEKIDLENLLLYIANNALAMAVRERKNLELGEVSNGPIRHPLPYGLSYILHNCLLINLGLFHFSRTITLTNLACHSCLLNCTPYLTRGLANDPQKN